MWRTGKAELITKTIVIVVGMSLDQVCDAVLWAPAVDDLLARIVGVHDVGPGDVTEITALFQLFNGLANLGVIKLLMDLQLSIILPIILIF